MNYDKFWHRSANVIEMLDAARGSNSLYQPLWMEGIIYSIILFAFVEHVVRRRSDALLKIWKSVRAKWFWKQSICLYDPCAKNSCLASSRFRLSARQLATVLISSWAFEIKKVRLDPLEHLPSLHGHPSSPPKPA